MPRLLIYAPTYETHREAIARIAPDLGVVLMDESGALTLDGAPTDIATAAPDAVWADVDVYLAPAAVRAFMAAISAAPSLDWAHSGMAGVDHPFFARLVRAGVRLTTSHGQSVGIADHILAAVLDHYVRGPDRRAAQAAKSWTPLEFREIAGGAWLIIGFGSIGQDVARRARAFGAKVWGVRREVSPHPLADRIVSMDAIPELLPEADVVVLCAPLTPLTRGLADAGFFAAMKPGSVFVNVGRGAQVDEAALLAALDRGVPAHAALDVFDVEPLPEDSPFWAHPRVALTAHAAGITDGLAARNAEIFLENLGRWVAGAPLLNLATPADLAEA